METKTGTTIDGTRAHAEYNAHDVDIEEASKRYPFSQYIYQKSHENTKASDIKLLMKNIGLPFEKAAAALELPQEEWSRYAKLIEQPSGRSVPG